MTAALYGGGDGCFSHVALTSLSRRSVFCTWWTTPLLTGIMSQWRDASLVPFVQITVIQL